MNATHCDIIHAQPVFFNYMPWKVNNQFILRMFLLVFKPLLET